MGASSDIVTLVLGTSVLARSVVPALRAWLETRSSRAVVSIRNDNSAIKFDLDDPVQAEKFVRSILDRRARERQSSE